jgi:tetratricopeptide (TPR) repeat protein
MALTLSAETWGRLGDPERARAERRRAAELPDDQGWSDPFVEEVLQLQQGLHPRLAHADELLQGGQFREALTLLADTVDRYPKSGQARLVLGEACRRLGRLDRAEQALREAVDVAPESAEAWFRLGSIQALLGREREAADRFRRAIRLKPDHAQAHFNLGHCLKVLGDPAGAGEEFREALRCRPDYTPAREALGRLEAGAGKAPAPPRR